ncbi:RAMP superfamily CRISPR-associated protein [Nocardia fluminea]|uniref:CRISPR/Cas system CSM-associated protein Csm3 (Group 7 of RAMP superfamily) n=1 Tax=Nocardia fluminea TaxID=134984 RepID=A0A2N3WYC3_9NOCA|nr:RAMP superfamily CRISPR-associated protein [Nocardia fluminea]PKV98902.1 CRISPR/Cas system CSM-associated protein Csm3 (group 7 of RAMP superfamily) [Nocardia fluminea]
MSALTARYTLTGELVTRSPLHIGAATPGSITDMEQVRDGLDRLVIPGTSLAGVLRSADGGDERWWGTHLTEAEVDRRGAHASRITIADAPAADGRVLIRDGVSIDRVTGAAAHRHLFSRQVVATGTRFAFTAWLEVARGDDDEAAATLMQELAARLIGGITVGAAASAGLGRLELDAAQLRREDFATPSGLFDALTERGTLIDLTADTPPRGTLRITIPWTPLGPIMSKVATAAGEAAAWPALDTDATGDHLRLLIPGTSIKGLLRGHAERIVRTLTGNTVDSTDPLVQLERSAALPAIGELFGAAADLAAGTPGRRGLLSVREVTSTVTIPVDRWQAARAAASAPATSATERDRRRLAFAAAIDRLNEQTAPHGLWFDIAARTAIDRWTGAASDGLLFTALEPHTDPEANAWSAIELELDLTRPSTIGIEALLALLLLLVRDLAEGWIPFGFGTTRGLGALRADPASITVTIDAQTPESVRSLSGKTLHDILTDPALATGLESAWHRALATSGATHS